MQSHRSASRLAKKYVGGSTIPEVLNTCSELNIKGFRASLFYMGEYHTDQVVIDKNVSEKKKIVQELQDTHFDIHISVDPTQIGYMVSEKEGSKHANDIANCVLHASENSKESKKNFFMIDMEDYTMVDPTIDLYNSLLKKKLPVAITLQAYLKRTKADIDKIIDSGGAIRLVKGAFAENSDIAFTKKKEIDRSYLTLSQMMLSYRAKSNGVYPIFGTHHRELIKKINQIASTNGWNKNEYEFEMLYGVCVDVQEELLSNGYSVRVYLPFGEDWWPHAVRRIGESTKNAKLLCRSLIS